VTIGSGVYRPLRVKFCHSLLTLTVVPTTLSHYRVSVLYLRDLCVWHGVCGVGLLNDARHILLRPTTVAMATNFGTKSAITRPICEISPRTLRITGGFRGRAIELRQKNSIAKNPRCHGNEIWDKTGYNSCCVGNITEMLAPGRGFFRNHAIEWRQTNSATTDPGWHGNEI